MIRMFEICTVNWCRWIFDEALRDFFADLVVPLRKARHDRLLATTTRRAACRQLQTSRHARTTTVEFTGNVGLCPCRFAIHK